MSDLEEKARDSPEVSLARQSAPGLYRLTTTDLVPADEITPEGDFPQYGDFLRVEVTSGGTDPEWSGTEYIECPAALARWLVENVEVGESFRIRSVQKVDGEWRYDCEAVVGDLDDLV